MVSLGIIVVEIPDVVENYPNSLTLYNTILIVKITGNLMKGRLCLLALHIYFTTRIVRSILGDVPVSTRQVHSTFPQLYIALEKIPINMNCCNFETTL